ncbi:MAG TPA: hypothetical protein VG329_10710 [Candidatus Dormibacteraeota bacterium]|nr:hypothetical protein [Candidatus Dormibacteraeota bacterium]
MLRHKSGKPDTTAKPQSGDLSAHLTFLDVIRDCCDRGGRFTLTAESPTAVAYTVLVDRGGPFNVSGEGQTGTDALVAAAQLSSGTYAIAEGWPVAQPLYQIGLDATLKMLSSGAMPAVVGDLPAARGVDSQRNAQPAATPAPVQPAATPVATPAPVQSAASPAPVQTAASPAPVQTYAPNPSTPFGSAPAPVASATLPAPPAKPSAALSPTTPVQSPAPTQPAATAPQAAAPLVDSLVPPMPVEKPAEETESLLPGGPTASADQGGLKHLVTQSILWLVQIDEPERYNLRQARRITTRAIGGSVRGLVHPFQHTAKARWQQAKQDWEKSGEVVAQQQKRQKRRVREMDVDPQSGPLSGR